MICWWSSDDEGSEDDEEGGDDDEEYVEEENDDDYEDYEDEDEDDAESPSFFFGKNPIQQQAWNNFQLGATTTTSAPAEQASGFDLSSMMASINVCSPFSFGSKSTTDVIHPSIDGSKDLQTFVSDPWKQMDNVDRFRQNERTSEGLFIRYDEIHHSRGDFFSSSLMNNRLIVQWNYWKRYGVIKVFHKTIVHSLRVNNPQAMRWRWIYLPFRKCIASIELEFRQWTKL